MIRMRLTQSYTASLMQISLVIPKRQRQLQRQLLFLRQDRIYKEHNVMGSLQQTGHAVHRLFHVMWEGVIVIMTKNVREILHVEQTIALLSFHLQEVTGAAALIVV